MVTDTEDVALNAETDVDSFTDVPVPHEVEAPAIEPGLEAVLTTIKEEKLFLSGHK